MHKTTSDAAARRAAKRVNLLASKSRSQPSLNNQGGFMLIDPHHNSVVAGSKHELSAKEVVKFCARPPRNGD
jgi:hypothetical protein